MEKIGGMTIYKGDRAALEQADFVGIQIHKNDKGWICVTAQK